MSNNKSEEQFVVAERAFECPWCSAVNDSVTAEWCSCLSSKPSLACSACGRCFCGAPRAWRDTFLTSRAATAFHRRSSELARSFVAPGPIGCAANLPRPIVVVVDDDRIVHAIARRVLADVAGTLVHATDGEAALRLALALRPDLVITDALLPKLDGRELCRQLKTTPETKDCKVAVMTGLYKGLRYRYEAFREFHADEYVEKPITPTALQTIAERFLPAVAVAS